MRMQKKGKKLHTFRIYTHILEGFVNEGKSIKVNHMSGVVC